MNDHRVFPHRLGRILGGLVLLLGVLGASTGPAWSQATSLFFSEYVEGSSFNKALEIYNGTGATLWTWRPSGTRSRSTSTATRPPGP